MTRRLWWVVLGLFLLAWGLAEAGVAVVRPVSVFMQWLFRLWPLLLVAWGLHLLIEHVRTRQTGHPVLGGVLVALGLALVADNLGYLQVSLWAAVLIGAGAGLLFRGLLD